MVSGPWSYVDQLVCTSGEQSERHGQGDVGTSSGVEEDEEEEYDRGRMATKGYRTDVRKKGQQGRKSAGCRYKISLFCPMIRLIISLRSI